MSALLTPLLPLAVQDSGCIDAVRMLAAIEENELSRKKSASAFLTVDLCSTDIDGDGDI